MARTSRGTSRSAVVMLIILPAAIAAALALKWFSGSGSPDVSEGHQPDGPALLGLIVPHRVVASQRHVMYAGIRSTAGRTAVHTRICTPEGACIVQRTVSSLPAGEAWIWIGAIGADAPPGEYEGNIFVMQPDEQGFQRTSDHVAWEVVVE